MIKKILFVLVVAFLVQNVWTVVQAKEITVYKSRFCGCCSNWTRYMNDNGFNVTEKPVENVASLKKKFGIPQHLSSCHTAVVEGYVLEGHVPVSDLRRLLKERPDIRGLAVRGMPTGAPGMEQGNRKDDFRVIAIRKDGSTFVYSSHKGN